MNDKKPHFWIPDEEVERVSKKPTGRTTPRDIVTLMAEIAFVPIMDKITDSSYLIYDGACGTGPCCGKFL